MANSLSLNFFIVSNAQYLTSGYPISSRSNITVVRLVKPTMGALGFDLLFKPVPPRAIPARIAEEVIHAYCGVPFPWRQSVSDLHAFVKIFAGSAVTKMDLTTSIFIASTIECPPFKPSLKFMRTHRL